MSILGPSRTLLLHQDAFARPLDTIPRIYGKLDWEDPRSLDLKAFHDAILRHGRRGRHVVAEGLFAFYGPALAGAYDVRFMIRIGREEFFRRRAEDIRWGREPDWYMEHVWESFQAYGEVGEDAPGYIHLDGTRLPDDQELTRLLGLPTT